MSYSYHLRCFVAACCVCFTAVAFADGSFSTGHSDVTYLDGLAEGLGGSDPLNTFTAGDFSSASSGPSATPVSVLGGYIPNHSLEYSGSAIWVGDIAPDGGYSTLFALPLTLSTSYTDAVLHVQASCDDRLGDTNNGFGIYFDGAGLSGTTTGVLWDGGKVTFNIGLGAVSAGSHTVYFDVWNSGGGPSGLIAGGSVSQAVPGPAAILAFALPGLSLLRRRRG